VSVASDLGITVPGVPAVAPAMPVPLAANDAGICANCGAALFGPFCARCGQGRDVHRHSLWHLLLEGIKHIANWDGRLMRTVSALLLKPGELALAFKEGRTQTYLPTPRLYLFVSLLFFLVLSLSGIALLQLEVAPTSPAALTEIREALARANPPAGRPLFNLESGEPGDATLTTKTHVFARIGSVHSSLTEGEWARLDRTQKRMASISIDTRSGRWAAQSALRGFKELALNPAALNQPLATWIPRLLFLLVPLFALLLALFHRRLRKSFLFVDHLVLSLNLHSLLFVVLIFAALAVQVLPSRVVAWATLLLVLFYGYLSLRRFYGEKPLKAAVKFAGIAFLYTVVFLVPALGIVLFLSLTET
jgi:hypothetical protein